MHGLFFPVLLPLFLLAGQVLGHGYVETVVIAGKSYQGNPPAEGTQYSPSIVRQILNTQPVKGVDNPNIVCGQSAKPAALVADANPGDTIGFRWTGAGKSKWPHVAGPILTYMASCGQVSCDKYDASQAKWFKISELGQRADKTWFQADVQQGKTIEVKIPSALGAGNYLVRQEIIALHIAMQPGGVEFYPSCTQLRIGGSQRGTPSGDLVTFPNGYPQDHPGLYVPGMYEPGFQYKMPGPKVAAIAQGGAAPPVDNTPKPTTSQKPPSAEKPAPAPTSTKGNPSPIATTMPPLDSPVMNAAPKPTVSSGAPAIAKPTASVVKTVKKCNGRRKAATSLQKRVPEPVSFPRDAPSPAVARAEVAAVAPVVPAAHPHRGRHFRRALSRLDSHH